MTTTDYHGWPLPDGTDLPFVHIDMKALADAMDRDMPVLVANIAARDALPPILNLKVYVASEDYALYVHNGTSWVGNKLSKGMMAEKKSTSNGVGISSLSVIENFQSFDFKGGRKYRIGWDLSYSQSTTDTWNGLRISFANPADAAGLTTGLTSVVYRICHAGAAGIQEGFMVQTFYEPTVDITRQVKFTVERPIGTGTWTLNAATDNQATYFIEDMGAQF